MKKYIIINRATRQIVWEGTMKDAQTLCFNPFVNEETVKKFANTMGNDLYKIA
jgi:hypothetical protein